MGFVLRVEPRAEGCVCPVCKPGDAWRTEGQVHNLCRTLYNENQVAWAAWGRGSPGDGRDGRVARAGVALGAFPLPSAHLWSPWPMLLAGRPGRTRAHVPGIYRIESESGEREEIIEFLEKIYNKGPRQFETQKTRRTVHVHVLRDAVPCACMCRHGCCTHAPPKNVRHQMYNGDRCASSTPSPQWPPSALTTQLWRRRSARGH